MIRIIENNETVDIYTKQEYEIQQIKEKLRISKKCHETARNDCIKLIETNFELEKRLKKIGYREKLLPWMFKVMYLTKRKVIRI